MEKTPAPQNPPVVVRIIGVLFNRIERHFATRELALTWIRTIGYENMPNVHIIPASDYRP